LKSKRGDGIFRRFGETPSERSQIAEVLEERNFRRIGGLEDIEVETELLPPETKI
jgi:hypothetical protein